MELISAIASTSYVGRTSAAASSVMRMAVVLPPTKTISPKSGLRRRAASASSSRLCFDIFRVQSAYQLFFCDFTFACSPISDGVNQGEQLIEGGIAQGCRGGSPI